MRSSGQMEVLPFARRVGHSGMPIGKKLNKKAWMQTGGYNC